MIRIQPLINDIARKVGKKKEKKKIKYKKEFDIGKTTNK